MEPETTSSADEEEVEIIMLGGYGKRFVTENKLSLASSEPGISSSLDKEDPSSSNHVTVADGREEGGLGAESQRTVANLDNVVGDNMSDCLNDKSDDPDATR